MNLDKELVSRIKNLRLEFKEEPQPELLIRIPNKDVGIPFQVEVTTSEFTSLCPLNMSQPDYATIWIRYIPRDWLVELKSLKFYLASYRQVPVFHERIPAAILNSLVKLLNPEYMEVVGQFTTRGGINTRVHAAFKAAEVTK